MILQLISRYYNNFLVGHFGVDKIKELIGRKYYWPSPKKDVKAYVKGCNMCLALKAVKNKLYSNIQLMLISIYY